MQSCVNQHHLGEVSELGNVDFPDGKSVGLATGVLDHLAERAHNAAVPLDAERAHDDPDNAGLSRALDEVVSDKR